MVNREAKKHVIRDKIKSKENQELKVTTLKAPRFRNINQTPLLTD